VFLEPDTSENTQALSSHLLSHTHVIASLHIYFPFFPTHSLDVPHFHIKRDIYNRPEDKGYRLMIPLSQRYHNKEIEQWHQEMIDEYVNDFLR